MIGDIFRPSKIEDKIYNIMEDYILGSDLYDYAVVDIISDYLSKHEKISYQLCCSPYINDTHFGVCAVSWCENGFPKMVMFDYCKEGVR